MDINFLVSAPKISSSLGVLPFFVSYKTPLYQRSKLSLSKDSGIASKQLEKSSFFGKTLVDFEYLSYVKKTHMPVFPIKAGAVKRRKENAFDNVIQREKKLKLVLKIRKILMSQPDRIMALRELGRYRRALGLNKKRRFIALLKKFPAVFEVVEEGAYSLKFKLTPEAERLYLEEMRVRNEMEDLLVVKLRKLLMMSEDKRILLEKISHLRTDLGLSLEFRDTICHRYPQYFKVVSTGRGPALELTHWDPELAVSAAEIAEEENRVKEREARDLIIDRPPKFNRVKLPKGLNLSKGEMRRISQFRDMPYISPYADFSHLRSGTIEKEKHACAVVHEILSLTVEKRTLVDHLTHFREEFRFSQQVRGMLIRHPDMFYLSLKGDRDSVFLREAYRDSQLIEKDRLLLIKEKLRSLVAVPRFSNRALNTTNTEQDEPEGSEDDEGQWSDIDNLASDELDVDDGGDEDYDDEWSDEDDIPPDFNGENPPDFNEDNRNVNIELSKQTKQVAGINKKEERVLVPAFPDGRPRERW
ncbi:hypothetical protein Leryth_008460 [Lithospermum erythrorhizon]|nr:hypothetical protein Leryth_008460 [Lithospermum erythrorhizon]